MELSAGINNISYWRERDEEERGRKSNNKLKDRSSQKVFKREEERRGDSETTAPCIMGKVVQTRPEQVSLSCANFRRAKYSRHYLAFKCFFIDFLQKTQSVPTFRRVLI